MGVDVEKIEEECCVNVDGRRCVVDDAFIQRLMSLFLPLEVGCILGACEWSMEP